MADQKVTALAENTTVLTTDILYLVDDPGGTPASEKATVANVCLAGQPDIGARVYNSGNLTIGTASWTALSFDSERYDTDTIHAGGTPTRLTATTAGTYLIVGNAQFASNALGIRGWRINLNNGTLIAYTQLQPQSAATNPSITLSTIYQLSATNFVEFDVYQNSGGDVNVLATANHSPEFMMHRIGA